VDPRGALLTFPQNTFNGYILGIYPPYRVKTGDRFRSTVNCAYGATSCFVWFRLDYQTGTGPITTYWSFLEKYEGQYYQADLDLSPLVGQDVKFILHVAAAGSPNGDRALWAGPIIYNPSVGSSASSSAASTTPSATSPAVTSTPPATTQASGPSGWGTYENTKYAFSFQYPPDSSVASQSDDAGRVFLPFAPATNLVQKYVDVTVVEDQAECKSPATTPQASSEEVTINGVPFLKQTGSEGTAGQMYDWIAYSSDKGGDCISLTFVLHASNPGNFPTPPATYDAAAESAVFSTIMDTFESE
jgi:hypothetical protein